VEPEQERLSDDEQGGMRREDGAQPGAGRRIGACERERQRAQDETRREDRARSAQRRHRGVDVSGYGDEIRHAAPQVGVSAV